MPRLLIVTTSHAALGDTGRRTGFHWEELATPYWIFRDAGIEVEIASVAGGPPPHDPCSLEAAVGANEPSVARFLRDPGAMALLRGAFPVAEADAGRYDGVFLPGGHGTMWDLPGSEPLARLVGSLFDRGGVVAAVCHGPAGLLAARRGDGRPIVAGRRVNAFTNAEEAAIGLTEAMPFLLETRLQELGAMFEGGPAFQAHAVRDAHLVTGQNPASAAAVARHVVDAVREAGAGVGVTLRLVSRAPIETLAILAEALPETRRAEGCRYSRTLTDADRPEVIVLEQGWESREHQRRYLTWREARGDLGRLLATLAEPPDVTVLVPRAA
ncbi:DJ-1/PfpI family protein [Roseomonas sp. CCTCC AB2023176]|uniref:DJ-1/PfpI family protein n=1 Tax=Roseomonas sp. CCTCC AB2023176 TaxID=3342640 RepID=UPI0035D5786F